jgi:CBS domain-containing protein
MDFSRAAEIRRFISFWISGKIDMIGVAKQLTHFNLKPLQNGKVFAMTKSVKDLMHIGLIACPPDASLGQVATLLTKHHVHALIVAEQNDEPLGIISDFDLLAGEWLSVDKESLDTMRRMTARDLMTSPIESIDADTPVEEAAKKMIEKQVHRMLVEEDDKPVGVISISNFVASIAAQEKAQRETVRDVMSDTFLVCRDKTPIISAARTMTQAGWRSVVIVDSKGRPLGVITGNDLMHHAGRTVDEKLTVTDLMNRDFTTIDINASLQQAADLMIQNHHHRVIVVDINDPQSFPLGVISSFDIVAEMARPGSIWQG